MPGGESGATRKAADATAVSSGETSAQGQPAIPAPGAGSPPGSYDVTLVPVSPQPQDSSASRPPSSNTRVLAAIGSVVLEPGSVLGGRYEIEKLLGMGGMGAVYQAKDRELDRVIGLKIIRPDLVGNAEILARFKRELILARQVTHRNIIRIFDLNEADGLKFITMEFIQGEDLRSIFMQKGRLQPEQAVEIMLQVAHGLAAAHAEGVIHRDLKPSNIMRDDSGRVVVMDFGLARTSASDGMTQTGLMIGTMEYMSPEQALGAQLDARSDLFAFGLIFYEALSGDIPFKADSAIASLVKRTTEAAKSLRDFDAAIPEGLSQIVGKCLEREPANRYASAEQILADLEAWRGKGTPTYATLPGPVTAIRPASTMALPAPGLTPAPATSAGQPKSSWFYIAVIAVVIIVGGAWVGWRVLHHATPVAENHAPVSVLVADFENHTGDPIFDGTLEPLFNSALEGASFINGYNRGDARKLASALPNHKGAALDEQSARLVAASEMISVVITGSISPRGDGYKISVEAMNGVSGNSIASAEVMATSKDAVMRAIPKLAAPIRQALGDSKPEAEQLAETQGSFSVSSLEAAHQYGVGMNQQFAGDLKGALASFTKASQLDSNFGRAYFGMAAVSRNMGNQDEAQAAFKMALAHADRMTERERFRTRGAYYYFIGNYQKCIEEYSSLVAQYPADNVGQTNLAMCYIRTRDMAKALEGARHAAELTPHGVLQRCNYALLLVYTGKFTDGEREAREALKMNPAYDLAFVTLADSLVGQGKPTDATATFEQMKKSVPSSASAAVLGLAEVSAYSGNFREATGTLENGIRSDLAAKDADSAAQKFASVASIYLAMGKPAEAAKAAEDALANSKALDVEFLAGRVLAETGQADRAHAVASALEAQQQPEPRAYGKDIEGLIALQKKDTAKAISLFSDAKSILKLWFGNVDLGRAYVQGGQFAEASSEFDTAIRRRGESLEALDNGPTYQFLPSAYYEQGTAMVGMKNSGAREMQTYLGMRGQSQDDPLVPEARRLSEGKK